MPSSARRAISSQNWRRASGSKPVVGSSRKSSSGRPMMPSATSSRRRWPPDRLRDPRAGLLGQADRLDHLVGVARGGVVARRSAGPSRARSARRCVGGGLQHDADPGPPRPVGRGRVHARARAPRRRRGGGSPRGSRRWCVLPAPFGPSRANTSPRWMSRSTPFTASTSPYRLRRPRTRTAVSLMGPASWRPAPHAIGCPVISVSTERGTLSAARTGTAGSRRR